ncbi:MAG: nucleotide-diphospho-sugar transferase [Pyrinomonadaceae bacterium]|nr:nucleotide-diphospho-sugar transferase [Sphingobacteriaceae bacterium]
MNSSLTPILFLIFNRPDSTKKVFEEIRKQKPKYLFIAADGPRQEDTGDYQKCKNTREIVSDIDWDCELKILFREKNLGCKFAVSSAITWFFEQVEEGIILEDDCLPNPSFFSYCAELLKKHQNDHKIMHISGTNLSDDIKFGDGSYYYSCYPHIWGWATWRRAWKKYDLELHDKKAYLKLINETFKYLSERIFWKSKLDSIKSNQIDTWDYQWLFSIWRERGLCLNSNYNLIENIGFGAEATHTTGNSPYVDAATKLLETIKHPSSSQIIIDSELRFINTVYGLKREGYVNYYFRRNLLQRIYNLKHKIGLLKINK